jgi:hypothetical protein
VGASTRNERAASQEHFIDLCQMLGEQTPNTDPSGDYYQFEKGATTPDGDGFADVWQRDHFGWAYKGKRKDLVAAYAQLQRYRESLANPPLLVVCDLDRFEVHTNWNTETWIYYFRNADIATSDPVEVKTISGAPAKDAPELTALQVLKALFEQPDRLRPERTREQITQSAAKMFGEISDELRKWHVDDMRIARFISKTMFCMFATDVGLLPRGTFSEVIRLHRESGDAESFRTYLSRLFKVMNKGGKFSMIDVPQFNGMLFRDADVPEHIGGQEIHTLERLDQLEWSDVEPTVFGTLFERVIDPKQRKKLGAHRLFAVYEGRVARESDLCCYWFEKARAAIEAGRAKRAGLLATQAIRGGANRKVLERIKETGDIFYAQADRPWVQDGVAVRVSMVGFDDGSEQNRLLNEETEGEAKNALLRSRPVASINANLTFEADVTTARRLKENLGICFQGPVVIGQFELTLAETRKMLAAPNPHGAPNSAVIFPYINAADLTRRARGWSIIDFDQRSAKDSAMFEAPFEHVVRHVKPKREENRRQRRREYWWHHGETVPGLKQAVIGLARFLATPRVAKHRVFVWVPAGTLPDSRVYVFARSDDYFFGVLHSKTHEAWSPRHVISARGGQRPDVQQQDVL